MSGYAGWRQEGRGRVRTGMGGLAGGNAGGWGLQGWWPGRLPGGRERRASIGLREASLVQRNSETMAKTNLTSFIAAPRLAVCTCRQLFPLTAPVHGPRAGILLLNMVLLLP